MSLHQVLCVGSACWDIVARTPHAMSLGDDKPGRISRQLGGVALNIACALVARGQSAALLAHVGADTAGEDLVREATAQGVNCAHVFRSATQTDTYLAIEDGMGALFGAIADCAGLEALAEDVLAPLRNGQLAGKGAPWRGHMIVDGNLPQAELEELASSMEFRFAHVAFVPASPGKATRLRDVVKRFGRTVYVNRIEAELICGYSFDSASAAARGLHRLGGGKAIVTDGAADAVQIDKNGLTRIEHKAVEGGSVTGAGDAFLAAHLAAEIAGADAEQALAEASNAATQHIQRSLP
ncbi:MAG: PfkB family carbohydrate kinase [Pseudomonadota bacterium]